MQTEILMTGIGGQGVQLCAKTLAHAAAVEGRRVQLTPTFGGEMRGGLTEAAIVIGEADMRALPLLADAEVVFVMHPKYWNRTDPRVSACRLAVINSSIVEVDDVAAAETLSVPASQLANESGNPLTAGFILLGAFAAATGVARVESLTAAMQSLVPSYRVQHLAANAAALAAGAAAGGHERFALRLNAEAVA